MRLRSRQAAIAVVCALLALTSWARAQGPSTGPAAWSPDSLQSAHLRQTRRLRISLPPGYADEGEQSRGYAVAIVLDAEDALFPALLPGLRLLESGIGPAVPPLIVIGVVSGRTRAHDMYPTAPRGMDVARPNAGGAPAFLAFLERELLPWVRARFRTLPYTVIAGHSAAGNLAIYAFSHSSAFQAAVAVSPAVFWLGPGISDEELTADYARRIRQRTDAARLYVGVGAYDPANIRRGVKTFVEQLGSPPAPLAFRYSILSEDNHQTARHGGLMEGFRWVFDPISLSRNHIYQVAGLDAIDTAAFLRAYRQTEAMYTAGARQLGFPPALPASFLGAWARNGGGPSYPDRLSPIAPVLCADYVRSYPEDPRSHGCAAMVSLAGGDSVGALRHYRAAATAAHAGRMTESAAHFEKVSAALDSALSRRTR